jgi:translation elongation factor EF-1alpha
MVEEKEIGMVTHYFGKINVAAIKITKDTLSPGDTIHIKGHTSDLTQQVASIQVDLKPIEKAKKGDAIGIKVSDHVRDKDVVYKVIP